MPILEQSKILALIKCRIVITGVDINIRHPEQETLYGSVIRGEDKIQFHDFLLPEHFDPDSEHLQASEVNIVIKRIVEYFIKQVTTYETWNSPTFQYEVRDVELSKVEV